MSKPNDQEYINRMLEQKEKNAQRVREHVINLYVSDPESKRRIKRLAAAEGRSVSNWFSHYFGSYVEAKLAEKEAAFQHLAESPPGQSASGHSASS